MSVNKRKDLARSCKFYYLQLDHLILQLRIKFKTSRRIQQEYGITNNQLIERKWVLYLHRRIITMVTNFITIHITIKSINSSKFIL